MKSSPAHLFVLPASLALCSSRQIAVVLCTRLEVAFPEKYAKVHYVRNLAASMALLSSFWVEATRVQVNGVLCLHLSLAA